MTRDGFIALVAVIAGAAGGVLWTRWRYQVVHELRLIRHLLQDEQEPTLRAIRDSLTVRAAPVQQASDTSSEASASQVQNLEDDSYTSDDLE